MPDVRKITEFRDAEEISELCHATKEPVFLTENGRDILVAMSIETYEERFGKAAGKDVAKP